MFSIEEATVVRPAATINIPAGGSREFGKDALERAIEEKAAAEQAETAEGIRTALARAWRKFTGREAIATHAEEAVR